jgi:tetratricopeptide (TPR) repeat protein
MGNDYFNRGDYDKAIFQFNIALDVEPGFGEAYNNRGLAYHAKGDNDKALADFEKAIQLRPNFASAYYNRGLIYYSNKDFDRAIADFRTVLELDNDPTMQQAAKIRLSAPGVK